MLEALLFTCTPIAIYDADGPIWCAEGPRIRIAGVAAREMDGTCSPGHPCPDMDPIEARAEVANILHARPTGIMRTGHLAIEGRAMNCREVGRSRNRVVADCTLSDGRSLSCAIIASKAAARWDRYWRQYRMRECD